jgi:hypothetical protein
MNKFFSFLALALLLCTASVAQQQAIISFKAMGHDDDPIYGMSGSNAYFLKLDPQYELEGSKLVLYFEPSQALLKDKSFINIIINDKPAYSSKLSTDSVQKVVLNLTREDMSAGQFLKIQVKTLATITDDKCKDLDNPAMWIKVKGSSYLVLNKSDKNFFSNVNISNCFDSKRAIVFPANPSLLDLRAVAWAYARLKKAGNNNILVFEDGKKPDTIRNYIVVGTMSELSPASQGLIKITPQTHDGLFYLHKDITVVTDTVTRLTTVGNVTTPTKTVVTEKAPTEILFITGADEEGFKKSITALGNLNILNSSFGDYLEINAAENTFFKTIDENRSKLSLKQIGATTNFMSGIGSLKSVFNFKNSDFSFTPKEIEIHFQGLYSGIIPGDRGFFNIYLNGSLISSQKLDISGKLNTSVLINRYQHHKYNTLEAEFRFYPNNGNCRDAFTNFFSEIDVDQSYLESKNPFISNDLSFYQYPEAFNSGNTCIVVSQDVAKYAAAAMGEVIYELNNNINANNFPTFVYSKDFSGNDLKKYNVVAFLSRNDKFMNDQNFPDAPIKFNKDFRLYNSENNKTVYSLSDSVSNGLAQIFYGRSNNATLVLTATGTQLADAFLAASRSITEQLSTLSSNVCISDVNNNKYLFNINKSSENLDYIDTKSPLTLFWESYNLYILLGILVLILLSFLYIRSRIQKTQEIFND